MEGSFILRGKAGREKKLGRTLEFSRDNFAQK